MDTKKTRVKDLKEDRQRKVIQSAILSLQDKRTLAEIVIERKTPPEDSSIFWVINFLEESLNHHKEDFKTVVHTKQEIEDLFTKFTYVARMEIPISSKNYDRLKNQYESFQENPDYRKIAPNFKFYLFDLIRKNIDKLVLPS